MPNFEKNTIDDKEKNEISDENLSIEKETDLVDFVQKKSNELGNFFDREITIDNKLDISEIELLQAQTEVNKINEEEQKVLTDWEKTSEAVIADPETSEIIESWRKSAEEQFGIKDFNLNIFKRTLFNDDEISKAFADGKEWNDIFENRGDFTESESYDEAVRVFEIMGELEDEVPGSVKKLNENFGIVNFQRYPKDILLNQLKENDPEKEVGLMIFAVSDWNGAFDKQADIWDKIYNKQKDRLNFRIVECSSKDTFLNQIKKVKEDYTKKISLSFMSSHSEPEGFYLGEESNTDSFVSKDDLKELMPLMKDAFASNAQMIGNACSSGAINGWVKDLSKEVRIEAVGPDRPAAIEDVDFVNNQIVPKYYNNDIYSGYKNGFLLSKKRKGK